MYISVFFGLIPTIKEEIIQIQCIVSLSLSIIAESYVRISQCLGSSVGVWYWVSTSVWDNTG